MDFIFVGMPPMMAETDATAGLGRVVSSAVVVDVLGTCDATAVVVREEFRLPVYEMNERAPPPYNTISTIAIS